MRIGILSDTHNHRQNTEAALQIFREQGVQLLVHCGDLTRPEMVAALQGFRVLFTYGNGDEVAAVEIQAALLALDEQNFTGHVYTGELDGVPLAATHGHIPGKVKELLAGGQYRYVFKGHSHRAQDETFGSTRLINPGALGGMHFFPRSVCVLDLQSGQADFIPVEPPTGS